MKQSWILLGLGGVAGGVVLFGCAAPPEIKPAVPPPTPAVISSSSLVAREEPPVQLVNSRFPLPAPTVLPLEEDPSLDDSNCVTCHTSDEMLKLLAKEPEAAESLSEGEG